MQQENARASLFFLSQIVGEIVAVLRSQYGVPLQAFAQLISEERGELAVGGAIGSGR